MCKILLSINPEHVENIFAGTKQYEFRKTKCKEKVEKIIIYSTFPVMKVVGEAKVKDVLVNRPDVVWNKTSELSGISKCFFDEYFHGRDKAVAYHLENVKKYRIPKDLSEYGIKNAPQSFVYVSY